VKRDPDKESLDVFEVISVYSNGKWQVCCVVWWWIGWGRCLV